MPNFDLFGLLGFGGTGFFATLAVLGLFWKADDAFSDELRDAFSNKLQGLKIDTEGVNWPRAFMQMFDQVFGDRHLTVRCFIRSTIASTVCYFVVLFSMLPFITVNNDIQLFKTKFEYVITMISFFPVFGITINALGDYISLLESRAIIRIISKNASIYRSMIFLFLDVIITTGIYFIMYMTAFAVISQPVLLEFLNKMLYEYLAFPTTVLPNIVIFIFPMQPYEFLIIVTYLTTLFTSVWVWVFIIGWAVVQNGSRFQIILRVLQFALPIKTKPMRAIGEVAALVTALAFIALAIFGVEFEPG
jgi:hypothetical protein